VHADAVPRQRGFTRWPTAQLRVRGHQLGVQMRRRRPCMGPGLGVGCQPVSASGGAVRMTGSRQYRHGPSTARNRPG
jgi:hypothetical protein